MKRKSRTILSARRSPARRRNAKKQKLTLEEARRRVADSKGARERNLTARHLLLHLDALPEASPEELAALNEYVERRGWKASSSTAD